MHVSGTFIPGAYTRPATSPVAAPSGTPQPASGDVKPRFFNAISSISHGSLADAYLAMKAQETGKGAVVSTSDTAVLSAVGMSGALGAYAEVLEDA